MPDEPMEFDGSTFCAPRDAVRLTQQWLDVWAVMRDGEWHTLHQISQITGHPEASISARLRDFRKLRFGRHTVQREYLFSGLWQYRLKPNPDIDIITKEPHAAGVLQEQPPAG